MLRFYVVHNRVDNNSQYTFTAYADYETQSFNN